MISLRVQQKPTAGWPDLFRRVRELLLCLTNLAEWLRTLSLTHCFPSRFNRNKVPQNASSELHRSQHALQFSQFTAASSSVIEVLLNIFISIFQATITLSELFFAGILSNIVLLIGYLLTVAICTHTLFSYHYSFNSLKVILKVIYCHLYMAVRMLW